MGRPGGAGRRKGGTAAAFRGRRAEDVPALGARGPISQALSAARSAAVTLGTTGEKPLDFAEAVCSLASYLNDLMQYPKAEIEALWCPWRVEYFEQETPNPDFLSDAARTSDDAAHLVV